MNQHIPFEPFPLNPTVQFRTCQEAAVDALLDYWRQPDSGHPVLNLATGAGKSITIGEICRRILNLSPGTRIGVVTINQELVLQDEADIKLVCPKVPVGVVMASLKRKEYKRQVIVGSIQSLYKSLAKTGGFHVILVDEGHLVSLYKPVDPETGEQPEDTTMFGKFLAANAKIVPQMRVCALTATPWRDNKKPIFGWERARFTEEIYRFGIGDAIKAGYLVPPVTEVQAEKIDVSNLKVSSATGDYTEKALAEVANDDAINVPAVAKTIEKLKTRDSAVVFCASVEHVKRRVEDDTQADRLGRFGFKKN